MPHDATKPAPNDSPDNPGVVTVTTPSDLQSRNGVTKPLTRGWRRHHELRKQDAADRDAMAAGLLESLGRAPTVADTIAAETISSLTVWARTLERRGQFAEAAKVRQQVTQAVRATGFRPQPASQKVDPIKALDDHLARQRAAEVAP